MKRIKKFNNFGRKTNEAYGAYTHANAFGQAKEAKILAQKLTEYVNWMNSLSPDYTDYNYEETLAKFGTISHSIKGMWEVYEDILTNKTDLDYNELDGHLNDLD